MLDSMRKFLTRRTSLVSALSTLFLTQLFWCTHAGGAQSAGMNVWAIGDAYRIDPLESKAYEVNQLLFPESGIGDYKRSNLVWDGSNNRVSLRAARNEIIAFQVIVERTGDAKLSDVSVNLQEFTGPGGARIPKENIDLYKEWYVKLSDRSAQDYSLGKGWYPDALIPCLRWSGHRFPHEYIFPFNIPDTLNNVSLKQRSQGLWIDVWVPPDARQAPPGIYRSKLDVSSSAGRASLDVELRLWDFALPEENHLRGNFHNDTDLNTLNPDLETKYYQMIRRHRLAMGVLGYAPEIKINGTDVVFDWTKYDDRLGKYLDGSAFTEKYGYRGPGAGIPIELTVLPFDAEPVNDYYDSRNVGFPYGKEWKFYRPWPAPIPKAGLTKEYGEIWTNAFRGFQKHFDERRWNRTMPIVFLLSLDESYDEPSQEKIIYYGELLKKSGAHSLKYRIDGSYPMETMKRLSKVVDISILGVRAYDSKRVNELREAGIEDWFYTGMGNMDSDPLGARALGWVSWKYQARSWTIWEFDFNSLRAWQYPETYSERGSGVHNGMAMWIYRGEAMGLDEPVASIRLKQLRRGSQDYEYFRLLSQKDGGRQKADTIVNGLLNQALGIEGDWGSPGMWRHNPEDWDRARIQAGDLIEVK
jgi:hypothetical protein